MSDADTLGQTRRPGVPRLVGMKPTKRFWDQESARTAKEMKERGCLTSEIAAHLNRSECSIRNFLKKDRTYPAALIPLADREKGITLKRCLKCEAEKPLADFAITHSKKSGERRWPYCKPCEIARLADRREKGLHLEKTRRHVAKYREKYPEKDLTNKIFGAAIRSGRIVRPESCEVCGQTPPRNRLGRSAVQGHHDDYSKPLEVRWFCQPCHIQHHRNLRNAASES